MVVERKKKRKKKTLHEHESPRVPAVFKSFLLRVLQPLQRLASTGSSINKTPTEHTETVSVGQIGGTHHRDGEVATTDFRGTAVLARVVTGSVRAGKTIGGRGVFAIVAGVPRFTQTSPGIAIPPFPGMASVVVPTAFKRIETFPPTVGGQFLFGRQRHVAHGSGQLPRVFVLCPGIGRLHQSLFQQSGFRRCGVHGKFAGWRGGRGGGWAGMCVK